ncbi:hypothetical protein BN7_1350 [Wickerhamomyces ciferrii]|uniref:F-box domain-containing protein n=1 Tax=Wickerhamomyces ciferrii (strain ATCC 14091 / BCRC 22168 / CBS 111 / JCM 3599 / NBRC 0793 / NRRL Y-1031 F-60-10) TaxID=1206466 RepID=K0KFX2_WICCF|nr:uncharacterized protein BN7_1350 [Wickerhamomyces ciferrii]CCH41811.1 hypothetical protein BN7_1350 [Wickerhamomyces ciferrii]
MQSIADLPQELLFHKILVPIDDIFDYIRLSRVCKNFQILIKCIILVVSDSSKESGVFNSIANRHVQIDPYGSDDTQTKLKENLKNFNYIIFEDQNLKSSA